MDAKEKLHRGITLNRGVGAVLTGRKICLTSAGPATTKLLSTRQGLRALESLGRTRSRHE